VSGANSHYSNRNRSPAKNIVCGLLFVSVCALFDYAATPARPTQLPLNVQRALAAVSPDELKGDLSFLASDALQGRFTPSPGLDVAAEFIASRFRAAGLEPGGDRGYFQMAEIVDRRLPAMTASLTLFVGERALVVQASEITVESASRAAHFDHVPILMFPSKDMALLKGLDLQGKAVAAVEADLTNLTVDQMQAMRHKVRTFDQAVANSGALANLTILHNKRTIFGAPSLLFLDQTTGRTPVLAVHSEELAKFISEHSHELTTLSADIPPPVDKHVLAKNLIGILRGSDPELSKTAVLLTAHYDHIGTIETATGMAMERTGDSADRIYNGANDDGSGTVSVIQIARALAKLQPRPKRSIVFMTFFGEERGELGSRFYGNHPIFPLSQTVADLNLEQMGRTDSTTGRHLNDASVTGFDYSDVTGFLIRAGVRVGIKVYRDVDGSDAYFTRSDNDALAEQGIPAHTLCVAFDFPDYHGLGDEWLKIDYENMAKVDRMVLLALLDLANSAEPPEWNAHNPKTEPYRVARAASKGAH
jgi:hypothetical protein